MPIPIYANFVLLITQSPKGYQARVIKSPVGDDAVVDFMLPSAWVDLGEAVWRTGDMSGALDLGRRLYDVIFVGEVGNSFVRNLAQANNQLRIVLYLDKGLASLAALPWEYLYSSHLNRYLAPSVETPLVRYLEVSRGVRLLPASPPLIVVGVLSNPARMKPLAVDAEWARVQEAMVGLGEERVRLEQIPATWSALQERLRQGPAHVLHFIGHGFFDDNAGQGGLIFEDDAKQPTPIYADQVKILLHDQPDLRLVFLNACDGAKGGRSDSFAGVAQQLVQQGVPAVVAMQFPISDRAALTLSREFYRALAAGYPVDAAVGEARKAIFGLGESLEWGTPVLFSRSEENRLIDVVEPAPPCPYPGMRPFTTEQTNAFYGRDAEIADAVDRLRRHPFLTVIGPSGSGKSSLVYAGIIPALQKSTLFGPGGWSVVSMRPGVTPLTSLTKAMDLTAPVPPGARRLLIVDQFEETFTLAKDEAIPFQEALLRLMAVEDLYLILTVRADFYPNLMASPLWENIQKRRLEVTPLGEAQLRESIVRPAETVHVTIEAALLERLVADAAGEPGVLPLVQETLVLLWEKVTHHSLTLATYETLLPVEAGAHTGLQVAISRHADGVYTDLSPTGQAIARRIFLRLIQFGEGRADTRRQQTVIDLRAGGDDPVVFDTTLAALIDTRLLTVNGNDADGTRRADISHEALIVGWPRLGEWVRHYHESEMVRRRLEDKAEEWIRLGGGEEGGLLDRTELAEVTTWEASPLAQELGMSQQLSSFVKKSRRVVNPGWATKGAIFLLLGGATLIASLALLPALVSSQAWPIQLGIYASVVIALFLLLFGLGLLPWKDSHRLQRLSQVLSKRAGAQIGLGIAAICACLVWAGYGIPRVNTLRYCAENGFTDRPAIAVRLALTGTGVDPFDLRIVLDELNASPEVLAWIVSPQMAERCNAQFSHLVSVNRSTLSKGSEVAFEAEIQEDTGAPAIHESVLRQVEQCDMFVELAQKIMYQLPVMRLMETSQQTARPSIASCQVFFNNQEGYQAYLQQDYPKAKLLLTEAVKDAPDFAVAQSNLGLVYLAEAQLEEAQQAFQRAADLWPTNGLFQLNLGLACYFLEDYPCSEAAYLQAIENEKADPTVPRVIVEAYNNLGVAYREWGKYPESEEAFSVGMDYLQKISADDSYSLLDLAFSKNRGILLAREEKWQAAIDQLQKVTQLDKEGRWTEEITYSLALAYQGVNDPKAACDMWNRYNAIQQSSRLFHVEQRRVEAEHRQQELRCPTP